MQKRYCQKKKKDVLMFFDKDENIRFEPCLCGGTRHEWWSGPEGVKVVCLRCGLESPWVPRSKGKNGVKKSWNAMILKNRKEQSHEDV